MCRTKGTVGNDTPFGVTDTGRGTDYTAARIACRKKSGPPDKKANRGKKDPDGPGRRRTARQKGQLPEPSGSGPSDGRGAKARVSAPGSGPAVCETVPADHHP